MAKAVVSGMPKLRIEEAAAKRQARIDSGQGGRGGARLLWVGGVTIWCVLQRPLWALTSTVWSKRSQWRCCPLTTAR